MQTLSPSQPGVPGVTPSCRNCGAEISAGKKFCSQCGTPVSFASPAPVQLSTTCSQCGIELKANAKFCSGCGLLVAVLSPQPAICHQCNAPLKTNARFCSSCGAAAVPPSLPHMRGVNTNPGMLSTSAGAGTEIWELPPWPLGLTPPPPPLSGAIHKIYPVKPVKVENQSQSERRCPNCHRVVAADKKFCGGCGSRLQAS